MIRRSTIRYQEPVASAEIFARCHPVTPEARAVLLEMLDEKKQAKLDLTVEIAGSDRPVGRLQRFVRRGAERRAELRRIMVPIWQLRSA